MKPEFHEVLIEGLELHNKMNDLLCQYDRNVVMVALGLTVALGSEELTRDLILRNINVVCDMVEDGTINIKEEKTDDATRDA